MLVINIDHHPQMPLQHGETISDTEGQILFYGANKSTILLITILFSHKLYAHYVKGLIYVIILTLHDFHQYQFSLYLL